MSEPALPRSVRRGPRITLTCHCGEVHYLQYGERWTCATCGRTWDTERIPLDEYLALRRVQLRYRRIPIAISVIALACVVGFLVAGKGLAGLVVVAFALTAWSMFARPFHRRRYREALAQLPSWDIEPE
jgi:hypothetical protein